MCGMMVHLATVDAGFYFNSCWFVGECYCSWPADCISGFIELVCVYALVMKSEIAWNPVLLQVWLEVLASHCYFLTAASLCRSPLLLQTGNSFHHFQFAGGC